VISVRQALAWTGVWVSLAFVFAGIVCFLYNRHVLGLGLAAAYPMYGRLAALQFLTGYVVEESLSLDNMVVIAIIFAYFRVPAELQHRVLFWGILGALVMRGAMIAVGTALIQRFDWVLYLFGAILIVSAFRLLLMNEEESIKEDNFLVRIARRFYAVSHQFHGARFFIRLNGRKHMTLLCLALLIVESSDLLFAVDSIPAVIAVTRDPFLVFTSNVFAILGLRSLYFALAGLVRRFKYLKTALVLLLAFVGVKMLIEGFYHIPPLVSFFVIIGLVTTGIVASLVNLWRKNQPLAPEDRESPPPPPSCD